MKFILSFLFFPVLLVAHCQMPCGIYHDQMIYDKIDEYYQTMYKAMAVLDDNNTKTAEDKNRFMRWVITKETMSDEISHVITTYFLQQKIAPAPDEETQELVNTLHKLLFTVVLIKQQVNTEIVEEFKKEWEHFKKLFHPDMDCEKRWEEAFGQYHEHEHDHEHPTKKKPNESTKSEDSTKGVEKSKQ